MDESGFSQTCAESQGGPGCYTPVTATVEVGGVVTMTNTDPTGVHTYTSGTVDGFTPSPDGTFDTGVLMSGDAFEWIPESAGEQPYYCMLHTWMIGTIIVQEAHADDNAAEEAAAAEAAAAEAAAAEAAAAVVARDPAIDLVDTLNYSISSGSVSSIMTNSDDATLVVAIDTSDDGELSINLDSDYITAFDDGSYFVLVNGEEVWFSQDGYDLTIPYESGTEKIEIVGSVVVPEFGTIAMIVLAVAIVSIIVLTTKTRTTLIPKL